MVCRNCEKEITDGVNCCPYCGQPVRKTEQEAKEKANEMKGKINDFAHDMDSQQVDVRGRKFTKLQFIMYIAGITGIIACFLPFAKADVAVLGETASENASFISGDGIFSILLIVAACALTFFGKRLLALIPAALNALMLIYYCFFNDAFGGYADGVTFGVVSLGIGAWIMLIAAAVLLVMAVLSFLSEKNK